MTADVPPDVDAVLAQLFREAREAFERGDIETGVAAVTSASSVATNKLPDSSPVTSGPNTADAIPPY